ncbi:hypothetical protein EJ05DRAFT_52510 [Pseudovirgaria hyperparasitica]|uniref:MARVEL domain-containing protein n=1 Tax=Pseudovirgaria hyperparasitica TaxID=470096 RepID=A0A6A6W4R8_9PEZI|nr:uncharacterized protein EJ05DRAFT_52510 [Pseudovirgaria hyperparasitica]KAF2757034.1 hypothetical protein EJ05DRAFT_52510 [Pseudovirgaria hyperparasitica]
MATNQKQTVVSLDRRDSNGSLAPSLKSPRTARFAEATTIISPVEPSRKQNPFLDPPTNHYMPQPQPSDVGFGYIGSTSVVEVEETDRQYLPPATPKTPLKSALKSPGAPPREYYNNVLSPTFKEEQILEKQEEFTEKEQAKDLKVKTRVRMAKMVLRGVNFACSLIVLAMLATVFSIFNATRNLPARSSLPPWAAKTQTWPQILLLVIACVSLFMSVVILTAYFRGGHKRAEKVAVYYTTFAVIFFIFSIVMWAVGAGVLNQSKANGNGQDLWGWSCKDNKRRKLFEDDVSYALVCRLQDWSLVCCIIEVVVEVFCIVIYGIVFYRYWSKRKLRKSMATRDRARSDLYLAQLKSQSAPNTPGFGPMSPRSGGWRPPPGHPLYVDPLSAAENGESDAVQYPRGVAQPRPFQLQAPPIKVQGATPKLSQDGFEQSGTPGSIPTSPTLAQRQYDHVPAAPGEQQYAAVPIPGAYVSPASPGFAPSATH